MLDGEQPDADDRRHQNHGELNEQNRNESHHQAEDTHQSDNCRIMGVDGAALLAPAFRRVERNPVEDQEYQRRQDDMGNDLLMARVELTPVLEGVVCSLFLLLQTNFLRVLRFTSACHRSVVHSYQRLGLFPSQK